MNSIFIDILCFALNTMQLILLFLILHKPTTKKRKVMVMIIIILMESVVFVEFVGLFPQYLRYIIDILSLILALLGGDWRNRFLSFLLYRLINCTVEGTVTFVNSIFVPEFFTKIAMNVSPYFEIADLEYNVIGLVVLVIYCKFYRKYSTTLTGSTWLIMSVLLYGNYQLMAYILRGTSTYIMEMPDISAIATQSIYISATVAILFIQLVTFIIYFSFRRTQTIYEERTRSQQLTTQLEVYQHQIDTQVLTDERTHEVRHETRNLLAVLRSQLEQGNYDDARERIDALIGETEYSVKVLTGISIVDAILAYKKEEADKSGIRFKVDAVPLETGSELSHALASMLGILLDNSLDACKKVADAEISCQTKVTCKIWQQKNILFITTENPLAEPLRFKEGHPVSSKGKGHGYGLRFLERLIEPYDGKFELVERDGMAVVMVSLFF